jgi:phosphatidylserine decarboxylase
MKILKDYLKTAPQWFTPKHQLSLGFGCLASIKNPRIKNHLIARFIRKYGVNMAEAIQEDYTHYLTFNDFFIRSLKPTCRPIANADLISPVDGCISEIGEINQGQLLQAKHWFYSVQSLLASEQPLAQKFEQGSFATLYLSPRDYHRVHMPIDATLSQLTYIPGKLFSVQPATVRVVKNLFSRNERLVALFDTAFGRMAMVMVGAAIVGTIGTTWHGDIQRKSHPYELPLPTQTALKKSQELGYFKLGSTVILLFEKRIPWQAKYQSGSQIKLGEHLGGRVYL